MRIADVLSFETRHGERIPFEVDSYVRQVQPAPPLLVDTNCVVPQCNSQ